MAKQASRASRACRIAAAIFGLVFVLHGIRLITNATVIIDTWPVPMTLSWLALLISGFLAWWTWRSARS